MEKAIDFASGTGALSATKDRHRPYVAVALLAAYVLLDWLTFHFPGRFGVTPLNPHAALAIALLMYCGPKWIPLVFLATAVGEITIQSVPRPFFVALLSGLILTAGYAAIAALLSNRLRVSMALTTRRDIVRLIAVTMACFLLCGIAYIGTLLYFDVGKQGRYFFGVRRFFIGYSVSVLVTAPLVLMAFSARRRGQIAAMSRSIEAWLIVSAIAACVSWVFTQEEPRHAHNFYLLFLPLVWAATRFGMVGAALCLVLTQAGWFLIFYLTGYQPQSVFELQLLLIALAVTGLLLGVSVDEQRRTDKDFRESLRLAAAGDMAAAIAHEINQPLTALSNYATAGQLIAAAPYPDREKLADTMDKLQAETRRTAAVVQRLREFFRAGATRLERAAIGDLVAKVARSLRGKADLAQVTLTYHAGANVPPVPPVLVDALQIEVVLRNLIVNAIESAAAEHERGGRVDINIETNGAGEVMVWVRDNGAGIRASDTQRLFEPFVTTKSSGMGMGLAISRAIVDAHGGRIWAVAGASGLLGIALPPNAPSGEIIKN